jgi:hypothetical protein
MRFNTAVLGVILIGATDGSNPLFRWWNRRKVYLGNGNVDNESGISSVRHDRVKIKPVARTSTLSAGPADEGRVPPPKRDTLFEYWKALAPEAEALQRSQRLVIPPLELASSVDANQLESWKSTVTLFNKLVKILNRVDTIEADSGWSPSMSYQPPPARMNGNSVPVSLERDESGTEYLIPLLQDPFPLAATYSSVVVEASLAQKGPDGHRRYSPSLDIIIKYTNDCQERLRTGGQYVPEDPLRDEYLILRTISELGLDISPAAYTLSLPIVPDTEKWLKNDFRTLTGYFLARPNDRRSCFKKGAVLRAIIEERVGMEVGTYAQSLLESTKGKNKLTLVSGVLMGLRIIILLEKLHIAGFIHGDIHPGNIVLKKRLPVRIDHEEQDQLYPELNLIDFGLSKFFPSEIGTETADKSHPDRLNPNLLSPWHFDRVRIGRRDDLYRAMEVTAALILSNDAFHGYIESFKGDRGELRRIKLSADFFTHSLYAGTTLCALHRDKKLGENCPRAMTELSGALIEIRNIDTVDATPNYESIKMRFTNALRLLGHSFYE